MRRDRSLMEGLYEERGKGEETRGRQDLESTICSVGGKSGKCGGSESMWRKYLKMEEIVISHVKCCQEDDESWPLDLANWTYNDYWFQVRLDKWHPSINCQGQDLVRVRQCSWSQLPAPHREQVPHTSWITGMATPVKCEETTVTQTTDFNGSETWGLSGSGPLR